jgi:hypothetical protein
MMTLALTYTALTFLAVAQGLEESWEQCRGTDPTCQLTLDDSAASISLLQHRGVPTKAASNVVTSPIADMQDAISRLKKEEADAEQTLVDLQGRMSAKDNVAYSQVAQPFEPVALAQQQSAVERFEASPPASVSPTGKAAEQMEGLPMAAFVEPPPPAPRQEATSRQLPPRQEVSAPVDARQEVDNRQEMTAPVDARQEVSQPQYNAVQMPLYAPSQPSQAAPQYSLPQSQSRSSSFGNSYSENMMQTKQQDQGSSALMNRLISAELAQTQALLQIQARQDELEKREMAFEEENFRTDVPNCTDYTKNGCGPVTDQATCKTCCVTGNGLRSGSYQTRGSIGICSCKVKENSYRTICHGIKTNLSMLTMMLGFLAPYLLF